MNAMKRLRWVTYGIAGSAALLMLILLVQQWRLASHISQLREALAGKEQYVAQALDVEKAVALGRESLRQGNWDLGQLYLVNAVTNAPRETRVIEEYANAVLEQDRVPADALERLRSLLELASFQVPPQDIPRLQELLNNTIKSIETMRSQGEGEPADGMSLAQDWARLRVDDATLANLAKQEGQLEERAQALADLMDAMNTSTDPALKEDLAEVNQAHTRLNETMQAVRLSRYIDQCLAKLDGKSIPLTSDRAVAVAQAAENALNGSWMIATDIIPAELSVQIREGYPKRIRETVDRIAKARSAQVLEQVEQALSTPVPLEDAAGLGPCEKECRDLQTRIEKAQVLALGITSDEIRKQASVRLRECVETLQAKRQAQYAAYQIWVVKLCSDTFNSYMKYKTVTSEEAKGEFQKSGLVTVDQSLLSPEVGRLFNDVSQKWLSRMGNTPLVQSQIDMSTGIKKKLEAF